MVDHTFPQNDDPNDAENFGEWGGRQNISDYVEYGLNFQNVDYGNLVFDVTEGKCYTLAPDAAAATTGELSGTQISSGWRPPWTRMDRTSRTSVRSTAIRSVQT